MSAPDRPQRRPRRWRHRRAHRADARPRRRAAPPRRRRTGIRITCLGTARGMETRLVPARGYDLRLIPPVPLPRKPTARPAARAGPGVAGGRGDPRPAGRAGAPTSSSASAATWPLPAYLAARRAECRSWSTSRTRCPGWPTGSGPASPPGWRPPRRAPRCTGPSTSACRCAGPSPRWTGPRCRAEARAHFGLDADRPTLLVFGGSQGAASLNRAAVGAADALDRRRRPGAARPRARRTPTSTVPARPAGSAPYVVVDYLERMDLAYAAADLALCRSGAMTVRRAVGGRAAGRLRAAARSATASSGATRCRSSRPGAGCWSRTPS